MSLQFSHLVIIEWLRRRHLNTPTLATLSAFRLEQCEAAFAQFPLDRVPPRLTRNGYLRHSARVVLRGVHRFALGTRVPLFPRKITTWLRRRKRSHLTMCARSTLSRFPCPPSCSPLTSTISVCRSESRCRASRYASSVATSTEPPEPQHGGAGAKYCARAKLSPNPQRIGRIQRRREHFHVRTGRSRRRDGSYPYLPTDLGASSVRFCRSAARLVDNNAAAVSLQGVGWAPREVSEHHRFTLRALGFARVRRIAHVCQHERHLQVGMAVPQATGTAAEHHAGADRRLLSWLGAEAPRAFRSLVSGTSEDFVPPAAQRGAVRWPERLRHSSRRIRQTCHCPISSV